MAQHNPPNEPQSTIWECLNIKHRNEPSFSWKEKTEGVFGPPHADLDVVSMTDVSGVEVFSKHLAAAAYDSITLTTESVPGWLQKESATMSAAKRPSLRVLMGRQIIRNDQLRPPLALPQTHISKTLLAECFHIPLMAAEKLGQEPSYTVEYPPVVAASPSIRSYAVVSGTCSAAWSYDAATGQTRALVVTRGSPSASVWQKRMCQVLGCLHAFSDLPGILPFAILDSMTDHAASAALNEQRGSEDDTLQISRRLHQVESISNLFLEATGRVDKVSHVLKHSCSTLDMCVRVDMSLPHRSGCITGNEWRDLQAHHEWLQKAIAFRKQELESLVDHARHLKERSDALLSTAIGVMTLNQQSTAQEIATATAEDSRVMKEIAAATKKDSTSMKILALMTMIFLPSTAISAIMAIPGIFDFSGTPGVSLVNSRFWIFFAVALPLTSMTMLFTWCWLRWENLGRPVWWAEWRRSRGGNDGGGGTASSSGTARDRSLEKMV